MTTTPASASDWAHTTPHPAGTPAVVNWERVSRETADQLEQTFPAMDTVTVDGVDIEVCEDWDDEFAGLLLSGHHDQPTTLAVVRAYLDAHRDDLIDAVPFDDAAFWANPKVTRGHIRWFLHHGDEAWTWVTQPTSRDLPVTAFVAPV